MTECPRVSQIDTREALQAPQDDCAVVGVYDPQGNAFEYTYESLLNQINRGRDSSGISGFTAEDIITQKGLGTPDKVSFEPFPTSMAVGHDRYTTHSETNAYNAQPFEVISEEGAWHAAFSHNGNVDPSVSELLKSEPAGDSDSAFMAQHIVESPGDTWPQKIRNAAKNFNGSYSATMLTPDGIYGFCDPRKNRDLWLSWNDEGMVVLSSESYPLEHGAFKDKNMQFRPVGAGELVHISPEGNVQIEQMFVPLDQAMCLLEDIYLKRGESRNGREPYVETNLLRFAAGEMLAQEEELFKETDPSNIAVVSIPNGGNMFAEGYSSKLGTTYPLLEKIIDSRSFMAQNGDHKVVAKQKMAINEEVLQQMILDGITDLVMIDDSLIRGSQSEPTMSLINGTLKRYEKEFQQFGLSITRMHIRIGSPKFKHPCGLGIAITDESELFYNRIKDPLQFLNVDSIEHLSLPGILEAFTGETPDKIVGPIPIALGYCFSCMWPEDEWMNPEDWYQNENLKEMTYSSRRESMQMA